jgi:putative ABC transport system substrate-binding protein
MRRREFIFGIGAISLSPCALAQQPPVVGFLNGESLNTFARRVAGFQKGLAEEGYTERQNLIVEYRWAEGQYDRIPALAADLVRQNVRVIAVNYPNVFEVKKATSTIPIVFTSAADPVKVGLVSSLNRPGANITGVYFIAQELEAKLLNLLHELVSKTAPIGVLVNRKYLDADRQLQEVHGAAAILNRQIQIEHAGTADEIDKAFSAAAEKRVAGLLVLSDPFFTRRRKQLVLLAARHKLPAIYNERDYAEDGGLITYGSDFADGYRLAGNYIGKILKGAKPADLPVLQPTKFELLINLTTAKALGLEVPPTLLARADEVID